MTMTFSDTVVPGFATFTGLAAVGNPRKIGSSKKFFLDVQFYLGIDGYDSLLGTASYFNSTDIPFKKNDVGIYMICCTIAKYEESHVDVQANDYSPASYDFIGDIQWIIPLTPPSSGHNINSSSFGIKTDYPVYLQVAGMASNCDKDQGTFNIDILQYISFFKDDNGAPKALGPFSCSIPDSPRYKLGRPVPTPKRYVFVNGFLDNIIQDPKSPEIIQHFHINVDNVIFLGYHSSSSTSSVGESSTPTRSLRTGKGLISYNRASAIPAMPSATGPSNSSATEQSTSSESVPAANEATAGTSAAPATPHARKRARTEAENA